MGERLTNGIDDRSERQKQIDAMYEASDARMHASMGREMRGEPTPLEKQASIDRLQGYKEMLMRRIESLQSDIERISIQIDEVDKIIAEEQAELNPVPELDKVLAEVNERLLKGEITFAEAEEALQDYGKGV